jgi:hypothetical protein
MIEATRGLVAPVSHGLWTAVTGSVLFRERRAGRFRLSRPVVGAYAFASSLHAAWDLAPGLATAIAQYAFGRGWQFPLLGGLASGTALVHGQVALEWLIEDTMLAVVAAIGLLALRKCRGLARPGSRLRRITPLVPKTACSPLAATAS